MNFEFFFVFCEGNRCSNFFGFVHKDCLHLVVDVLANADRNAWLNDACFLASYLGKRVTKELNMVEADVRNDAQFWRNDVRAIQPASQADLNHGKVHLLLLEVLESESSSKLEEGKRRPLSVSPVRE